MAAPRLTRGRLLAALALIAADRIPDSDGVRPARRGELAAFAADALAPVLLNGCSWCSGRGCPACEADPARELHSRVLATIRAEEPISGRELRRRLSGGPRAITQAMWALERDGLIGREGAGRQTRWRTRTPR